MIYLFNFNVGEYFVVGVDIEQYDASSPDKYLRGLLQDKTDMDCIDAFRSYLGIIPSAPINFDSFARQVNNNNNNNKNCISFNLKHFR